MTDQEQPRSSRSLRIGIGAAIVVVIGIFAVVVGMGVLRTAGEQVAAVPFAASATSAPLYVHVSGAVEAPGVYVLDDGARIVDAISAAGGFRDDAEKRGINLARLVIDGEQIDVPVVGAEGEEAGDGGINDGLINVNTADASELASLPRIGEALAERIITWRTENGPFRAVDDLGNVSGIGEKMLESLRPLVKVG